MGKFLSKFELLPMILPTLYLSLNGCGSRGPAISSVASPAAPGPASLAARAAPPPAFTGIRGFGPALTIQKRRNIYLGTAFIEIKFMVFLYFKYVIRTPNDLIPTN